MQPIRISVWELKTRLERKAFAYGVPSAVSTLLAEYAVEVLREAGKRQTNLSSQSSLDAYANFEQSDVREALV